MTRFFHRMEKQGQGPYRLKVLVSSNKFRETAGPDSGESADSLPLSTLLRYTFRDAYHIESHTANHMTSPKRSIWRSCSAPLSMM